MRIVLEGPDNSGKSTLAQSLSQTLNLPVYRSPGACKSPLDYLQRYWFYRTHPGIYDRFAVVSEPIYTRALERRSMEVAFVRRRFYEDNPILIYCANTRGLDGHVADSAMDTPRYLNRLTQVHNMVCRLYDQWAFAHNAVTYRIGDDDTTVYQHIVTKHEVQQLVKRSMAQ